MNKQRYVMFAGYNQWANSRLYEAVSALSDAQYRADRGAFFGSVHGTLNHLLATDRIWMRRFTGEGEAPSRLDAILFEDFAALREARAAEDSRIVAWVNGLAPEAFDGVIRYKRVSDDSVIEQELGYALDHLFNHQTHHRGQAHALLTGLVGKAPELDLLFYQRESGVGGARRVG